MVLVFLRVMVVVAMVFEEVLMGMPRYEEQNAVADLCWAPCVARLFTVLQNA